MGKIRVEATTEGNRQYFETIEEKVADPGRWAVGKYDENRVGLYSSLKIMVRDHERKSACDRAPDWAVSAAALLAV
jgi:hypothetical protein